MSTHIPVLLHESIDSLDLQAGDTFLDGTLGGGGHSSLVAERFGGSVRIIGLDRDPSALERSRERLQPLTTNFELFNESFRNLDQVLAQINVNSVNAVLLDIGISSDQLESSEKGFSFQKDEPLDMRMGTEGITAADILNTFPEATLELIIRGFGEERYSRQIAREIVTRRENEPFSKTSHLVDAILASVPGAYRHGKINPATRTFQALRIAVNEELTALEEGMQKAFEVLSPQGRLAIISFHSLEDRLVKNYFRDLSKAERGELITNPSTKLKAGKPITPSEEEILSNPRSRSAKLRIIQKN